jgi:glycosyltransferase involved in cell wall biosynthesis
LGAAHVAAASLWNKRAATAASALLASFQPDVVHVHKLYPQLSVAPVVEASRRRIPIVQTLHDYEFISASPLDHTGRPVDTTETHLSYRALNSALFQVKRHIHAPKVSTWIAVSRAVAHAYSEHQIDATVMPNFTDLPSEPAPFSQRTGVLYLGRLSEEKGIKDVVESARSLPSIEHSIAGNGPMDSYVAAAAKGLPNLRVLGPLTRAEVASHLSAARLVLMPSLWQEPGPLTALEALAHGTPVIAYSHGGLGEYVSDSGGGLAVRPAPADLVAAVTVMYADETRWTEASGLARASAEGTHSTERYCDALEDLYRAALKSDL